MTGEVDRMSRAGSYVLGLTGDAYRERAERELEVDPEFRDAVLRVAERLRLIDLNPAAEPGAPDRWQMLAQRISEMPHMRPGGESPGRAQRRRHRPRPARRPLAAGRRPGDHPHRDVRGGLSCGALARVSGIRQAIPTSAPPPRNQPKPAKP